MAHDPPELARLLEEGLFLYGKGDLDGALLAWEQVLAVVPAHKLANSYVDYLRAHYDLLIAGEARVDEAATEARLAPHPLAADGAPDYRIPVDLAALTGLPATPPSGAASDLTVPAATSLAAASAVAADLDEGWFMDDEPAPAAPAPVSAEAAPPLTLELDGEEPVTPAAEVNFEDATREYDARDARDAREAVRPAARVASAAAEALAAAEFGPQETPGFDQPTDVRARDLGFVRPTSARVSTSERTTEIPVHHRAAASARVSTSERTAEAVAYGGDDPTGTHARAPARTTRDLPGALVTPSPPILPPDRDAPTGRLHPAAVSISAFDLDDAPAEPPAPSPSAPTRDLNGLELELELGPSGLDGRPTLQLERPPARAADPMVSAPTRELGLRPAGREATQGEPVAARARAARDGAAAETRADIVLPFDPIAARSAQILDEVDAEGAPGEPREEQVRRRITGLLERAARWTGDGEIDRAVAAVDLALSEDPDSALAQKLVQRHRDAILGVFQQFLGELDRAPVLARPLHELASAPISPRAAFLLSRVDGTLTIDEILDVSGMPRLEAYRHLSQLFLRGILR